MTTLTTQLPTEAELAALEEKFDPDMRFRAVAPPATWIVRGLLLVLSFFHYYTAGFGLLRESTHRGVHLAFVLGLIFLVFAHSKKAAETTPTNRWAAPGGIPLLDWILVIISAISVMYIPYIFEDLAFRVGNPETIDVVMGTILLLTLLEATRRSMGMALVWIAVAFIIDRKSTR